MPLYDYQCQNEKCRIVFEVEKKMVDPDPKKCPACACRKIARYWGSDSAPAVGYGDRPPWTYSEAKKYKTAKWKGMEFKIDPNKHGDIGSANSPGEVVKTKPKKRPK